LRVQLKAGAHAIAQKGQAFRARIIS
jgi:hypothetical protein